MLQMVGFIAALVFVLGSFSNASANLVDGGTIDTQRGFGDRNTILTFHTTGTEVGCVRWTGSADALGAPCAGLSASTYNQTDGSTYDLTFLGTKGITAADRLGIVFDASEEGGGPITVDKVVLVFFDQNGTVGGTYTFTGPATYDGNPGSSGQGVIFRLDWAQAQLAQAAFFTGVNFGNNRIGLSASLSQADGGQDTFYLTALAPWNNPVNNPEPAPFLTMGAGLLALGYFLRRRNKKV